MAQQPMAPDAHLNVEPLPEIIDARVSSAKDRPTVVRWAVAMLAAAALAGTALAVLCIGDELEASSETHDEVLAGAAEPGPAEILLRQLQEGHGRNAAQELALHTSVGHIFRDQGRYMEASRHYKAALDLAQSGPEIVTAKQLLGLVEYHRGHLKAARSHLESAFVLVDSNGDGALAVLRTLADVRRDMGHVDDALRLYNKAWTLAVSHSDVDQLPLLAADTSEAYARRGEADTAMEWLKLAGQQLELNRMAPAGEDGSATAKVQSYLGATHHAQGDVQRASELYRKALQVQARVLRPSHPDLVATRMALARAQRDLGDSEGSLRALGAVELTLRSGPKEGPDLSRVLILKSDLLREAKMYDEATEVIKEAVGLQSGCFQGEDHPETAVALSSFGSILHDQGKLDEAHQKYDDALRVNLNTVGSQHPETAATYNSLGTLYEDAGEDKLAQTHFTKCLEIQLATVGEASPDVSNTYNNLATVLFRRGSIKEAEALLREALRLLDKAGVPKANPDRGIYEENLAEVLQALEKAPTAPMTARPSVASVLHLGS